MDDTGLLILEVALIINLIVGGALWFTFRELRRSRLHTMKLRRENARLKQKSLNDKSTPQSPSSLNQSDDLSTDFLSQSLLKLNTFIAENCANEPPEILLTSTRPDHRILAIRKLFLTEEIEARKSDNTLDLASFGVSLAAKIPFELKLSDDAPAIAPSPLNQNPSGHAEIVHYQGLYNDLLLTLQKSRDTIRTLALRLSEMVGSGIEEDKLNDLLNDLNISMETFAELSGISSNEGTAQMEAEVKGIRKAYEHGMNLLEFFEQAIKSSEQLTAETSEHRQLVESNRVHFENNENLDRETILDTNKRYHRLLDESQIQVENIRTKLNDGKEIISDFLRMTRAFQDQSTRIEILQSREKQLNTDVKQLKLAQQDSIKQIECRDSQIAALFSKFVADDTSENTNKIVQLAEQVYQIEKEIRSLDQLENNSSHRTTRAERVQQRLAIEEQIRTIQNL